MTGIGTLSSQEMKILYHKKRRDGFTHKQAIKALGKEFLFVRDNHKKIKKAQPRASNGFQKAFSKLVSARRMK